MPTIGIYITDDVYAWLMKPNNTKPQKTAQDIIKAAYEVAVKEGST